MTHENKNTELAIKAKQFAMKRVFQKDFSAANFNAITDGAPDAAQQVIDKCVVNQLHAGASRQELKSALSAYLQRFVEHGQSHAVIAKEHAYGFVFRNQELDIIQMYNDLLEADAESERMNDLVALADPLELYEHHEPCALIEELMHLKAGFESAMNEASELYI